ncbi:hypothetical protein QTP70_001920 [Hemibagrus guttatus]|uniref:Receptor expression-enhancing protein n=1 Tax=Hemibagrus guttatus TaxID=175788 RepID=A0AAE0V452_9TELE|nr:hypothetical protein QTP70_001920 [Hemibagrus guttatus]
MKVSRSKTEYMCVNEREGSGTVRLQGEEVKKVQEFKYLGSTVQSNGECGKEVKWMMYWIVFALFTTAETITDMLLSWFPFYFELKIAFVIWLLSPYTKGSSVLYRKFVHPMLSNKEKEIDEYITQAKDRSYETMMRFGKRGLNIAATAAVTAATKGQGVLSEKLRSFSLQDLTLIQNEEELMDDTHTAATLPRAKTRTVRPTSISTDTESQLSSRSDIDQSDGRMEHSDEDAADKVPKRTASMRAAKKPTTAKTERLQSSLADVRGWTLLHNTGQAISAKTLKLCFPSCRPIGFENSKRHGSWPVCRGGVRLTFRLSRFPQCRLGRGNEFPLSRGLLHLIWIYLTLDKCGQMSSSLALLRGEGWRAYVRMSGWREMEFRGVDKAGNKKSAGATVGPLGKAVATHAMKMVWCRENGAKVEVVRVACRKQETTEGIATARGVTSKGRVTGGRQCNKMCMFELASALCVSGGWVHKTKFRMGENRDAGTSASLITEPTLKSHTPYQYTSCHICPSTELPCKKLLRITKQIHHLVCRLFTVDTATKQFLTPEEKLMLEIFLSFSKG